MENTKKNLKKNEEAVSPVIGVIMLIAITVIIAAVVAAFAYGIIGGVQKAPSSAMVLEGSNAGSIALTIIHHGGDSIIDAFKGVDGTGPGAFNNLEVRRNGATLTVALATSTLNGNVDWDPGVGNMTSFTPGDEIQFDFSADDLDSGDSLVVLYKPTGDILQRTTVT